MAADVIVASASNSTPSSATASSTPVSSTPVSSTSVTSIIDDLLEVTKPKVVLLLVFTAIVGMVLAVPGWLPLQETVFGILGIGLASASAAAINHVVDQKADALMNLSLIHI